MLFKITDTRFVRNGARRGDHIWVSCAVFGNEIRGKPVIKMHAGEDLKNSPRIYFPTHIGYFITRHVLWWDRSFWRTGEDPCVIIDAEEVQGDCDLV
jgi:hypothetical protein